MTGQVHLSISISWAKHCQDIRDITLYLLERGGEGQEDHVVQVGQKVNRVLHWALSPDPSAQAFRSDQHVLCRHGMHYDSSPSLNWIKSTSIDCSRSLSSSKNELHSFFWWFSATSTSLSLLQCTCEANMEATLWELFFIIIVMFWLAEAAQVIGSPEPSFMRVAEVS